MGAIDSREAKRLFQAQGGPWAKVASGPGYLAKGFKWRPESLTGSKDGGAELNRQLLKDHLPTHGAFPSALSLGSCQRTFPGGEGATFLVLEADYQDYRAAAQADCTVLGNTGECIHCCHMNK